MNVPTAAHQVVDNNDPEILGDPQDGATMHQTEGAVTVVLAFEHLKPKITREMPRERTVPFAQSSQRKRLPRVIWSRPSTETVL